MTKSGPDTQPSAITYELDDLVGLAWSGRIRVPHFQRDFRWGLEDVIRLLDSIVRGYPIGNLLLWVRPSVKERITLGVLSMEAPEGGEALWIVDGQQRVTSLANTLHPDGALSSTFSVDYDLEQRIFVPHAKLPEPHLIPLPVLFDLEKLVEWMAATKPAEGYFAEARRVAKLLRQFKVPATLVRQEDEGTLTDIFDRMNNYGKRLSRAEIFSALFAGPEEGARNRLSLPQIAERVAAQTGFGTIDTNTVLHAVLARRGPDFSRDIRSEFDDKSRRSDPEFPGEDQETAFSEGEKALLRAVEFLQQVAGVPHLSLLAYKAPLVVLTRFFAHFPEPQPRNLQLLRRAYWRVATSGPVVFKGSFSAMGRTLCALVIPGDETGSVDGLVKSMEAAGPTVPNPARFRTNEATGKIILCSWWDLRPRSASSGLPYDAHELSNVLADETTAALAVRQIYSSRLDGNKRLWAANRVFVPSQTDSADTLLEAVGQQPVDLDDATWEKVLTSHCMDREIATYYAQGLRDEFLTARQAKISSTLQNFLSRMAEWNLEDTPALDSLDLDELDDLPDGT